MTREQRDDLLDFLRRKQCGPCRRGPLQADHTGCAEAAHLIRVVEAEVPQG
jgi:hypothetical protein